MLRKPEYAFSLLALLFGFAFLVVTPPFQVADEPAHFLRAYCLAEGQFGTECNVPLDLLGFSNEFRSIAFRPEAKTSAAGILALGKRSIDRSSRGSTSYPGVTVLPVAHLAPAAGVGLARLTGGGPLALFYSGRVANLLASTLIVGLAIWIAPFFK